MNFVSGIEAQPNFPEEDLTEANAEMLALMLSNRAEVAMGHQMSEGISLIFRMGHPAVLRGASKIYDEENRLLAIDYGVSVFEAAASIVMSTSALSSPEELIERRMAPVMDHLRPNVLDAYVSDAYDAVRAETPRLAEMTIETSQRFHGHLATYALLGVAIERKLILDLSE